MCLPRSISTSASSAWHAGEPAEPGGRQPPGAIAIDRRNSDEEHAREHDRAALELDADDYLVKPSALAELIALGRRGPIVCDRVAALARFA
jgi:CheY-like chemotaxis protein